MSDGNKDTTSPTRLTNVKFDYLNRRLHLYAALLLWPWFAMYAVSSLAIHHRSMFEPAESNNTTSSRLFERAYTRELPADGDVNEIAGQILRDVDLEGMFRAKRIAADQIEIQRLSFWSQTILRYDANQQRLVAERQPFSADQFLVRMHIRAGFQDGYGNDAWAVMVDIVSIGFLIWIATGLTMWWSIKSTRLWGWLAIAAGFGCFVWFVAAL